MRRNGTWTEWLYGSFTCIGAIACASVSDRERPDLMTTKVDRTFGSQEGWLAGSSNWHINSPGMDYSVRAIPRFSEKKEPSLRFELRKGDAWTGPKGSRTHRAEVIPGTFADRGSVRYYGCNVLIPADFPIEVNRLVILQWWPETKTELGEVGRSPSLAVRYVAGTLSVSVRHSSERIVKDPDQVSHERIFKTDDFRRGEWNRLAFRVKWSFREDGEVNFWWNDQMVASYRGPVGYNDDKGPLFKFGLYRDDSPQAYVVYFSECRESEHPSGIVPMDQGHLRSSTSQTRM